MDVSKVNDDKDNRSLVFDVWIKLNGSLLILLDRDILDSKNGQNDDEFIVLANGKEIVFSDGVHNDSTRHIEIPNIPYNITEIEIVGS